MTGGTGGVAAGAGGAITAGTSASGSGAGGAGGTGSMVVPPQLELIDDLEDGDGRILEAGGRSGPWYVVSDGQSSASATGPLKPEPDGSTQAIHFKLNADSSDWGAGIQVDFKNPGTEATASGRTSVDASAHTGLTFRAKGSGKVRLKVNTAGVISTEQGGTCSSDCFNSHGAELTLSASWKTYVVPFGAASGLMPEGERVKLSQEAGWGTMVGFKSSELIGITAQFGKAYELWIDDLAFFTKGSGGDTASGGSGPLGPGPALPDITGGATYWASRYWDCCKPHCAWQGMPSCGADGVSRNGGDSACSGGPAYACYEEAPRAIGTNVSYGYIAVPNPSCGKCYHLQFTGTGQFSAGDPGSVLLAGKHMIVKVTNAGGDVAGNQFDLMIPGGGVGLNPGTCKQQWGVANEADLGPTSGGFLTGCSSAGGLAAKKECVRQKCNLIPAGDARDGCFWFVDWYQAADNPNFRYAEIDCPSDL